MLKSLICGNKVLIGFFQTVTDKRKWPNISMAYIPIRLWLYTTEMLEHFKR